ncbi:MAG: hypothetical protein ACSHW0_03425 [Thalassotalea sp.]
MNQKHLGRLNQLFEKMLTNSVSVSEKNELTTLYGQFFEEGRADNKLKLANQQHKLSAAAINQ